MKHCLIVFVLLLVVSTGVSAQVGTTAITTEKKGLKWFIDDAVYNPEKGKFSNWLNTFSFNISGTAKHVTLRHGSISPTVYTGNSFGFLAYMEKTDPKNYWQIGPLALDWGNLNPGNLDPLLDKKEFITTYHYNEIVFGSWARRLKKSPHYLGVYFSGEQISLNNANSNFNNWREEDGAQRILEGGVYLGVLHLYHNELLGVPFRTRTKIPFLPVNLFPYGEKSFMHANYNFRVDFLLNKKQNRKLWLSYSWNFFKLKKTSEIYNVSKGSSGIFVTLSI